MAVCSWESKWTPNPLYGVRILAPPLPCECDGSTTVFEAVRRGSIPRQGAANPLMPSECHGRARDPTKVEDQVRFLARVLNSRLVAKVAPHYSKSRN